MLSISSNNSYTKSQNSVNFKSNILKTPALKEAINATKADLSNIGIPERGKQFFRALDGLKMDLKNDTIALQGEYISTPFINVNNKTVTSGKIYQNAPQDFGSQAQMTLIDFAKERGIDVKQPVLVIEERVDMLKKQLADTEQKMFEAIRTKLDNFIEK